jgi:RNA polymerase sigma-70 factor (ECF subfamily)
MQMDATPLPILYGAGPLTTTATQSESRRSRRKRTRELVDAARRCEPGSFEALYREYLKVVSAVALAFGPLREKDDIIQASFLLALEKLNTLKDPDKFGAWLRTITKNVAIDHLRKSGKHADGESECRDPRALSETGRVAVVSALELIGVLDDDYRDIILMAYSEEMTRAEIAEVTGLTEGSVRVKLTRGLAKMRAVVNGEKEGR